MSFLRKTRASLKDLKEQLSGFIISQTVNTFSDLEAGEKVGEFAEVMNPEGTAWLPYSAGGTYYPAGIYRWDGSIWKSNRTAISSALYDLYDKLATTQEDVLELKVGASIISAFEAIYDGQYLYTGFNITDSGTYIIDRHDGSVLTKATGVGVAPTDLVSISALTYS